MRLFCDLTPKTAPQDLGFITSRITTYHTLLLLTSLSLSACSLQIQDLTNKSFVLSLSDCVPSEPISVPLSSGRGLSCYEVLQEQTSSSEAGCVLWESGLEVGSSPMEWRDGELSLNAEPNLQEGTRFRLHVLFLSNSAVSSVSCDMYEEQRALECALIEGCLLKLDSQPIIYEGGVATINFQNNDRCNSSTSEAFTQLEQLDQLDNDCDGLVDERLGLGQPCTVGLGECVADGEYIRSVSGVEVCNATPGLPRVELCLNDTDEDCDGRTDEGFEELNQPCLLAGESTPSGQLRCLTSDRSKLTCVPSMFDEDSGCDGVDSDRDGRVDEGYIIRRVECEPGACSVSGYELCIQGRLQSTCATGASAPNALDLCDGVDSDCDGQVDEDAFNERITCGQGACLQEGVRRCERTQWVEECTPLEPSEEQCDGLDNDCDGQVDESDPALNQECTVGIGACRANGSNLCVNGDITCSAQPGTPQAEVLDMLDNDCDGQIDEGI